MGEVGAAPGVWNLRVPASWGSVIRMNTNPDSANGTTVNDIVVTDKGRPLRDGDIIVFGKTYVLFRAS